MQAINAAVLSPVFFVAFSGAGALAVGVGVWAGLQWEQAGAVCLWLAAWCTRSAACF